MKKFNQRQDLNLVLGILAIIGLFGGLTYAFFNYTRTGGANSLKVGRVSFNSTQEENISLTNLFPVSSDEIDNVLESGNNVTINITGDTTYGEGVEYLVTAEDVNINVGEKRIPINLYVSGTSNLGSNDEEYFDNRGGEESFYKVLSGGVVVPGQYLLVGYIAPGQSGIDGSLNIKAYIDKDKIAITDTPEENIEWQRGRTVFTTEEWNSIQNTGHELSFKVRVEANEGIWVDPYTTPNLMNTINFNRNAVNIKEIRFIEETPLRMQRRYDASVGEERNGTKLEQTYQETGKVLAWIEPISVNPTGTNNELLKLKPKFLGTLEGQNNIETIANEESYILYIASSGKTKWVTGSGLFYGFTNVEKITFENIDSSDVTTMSGMFYGLSNLVSVEGLNALDTGNVTSMDAMFQNCTSLKRINLKGLNLDNVTGMNVMFQNCTNLEEVNLSNLTTNSVTGMTEMFSGCSSLTSIDLSGMGSNSLTNVNSMFAGCTSLKNINMSNFNFGSINSFDTNGIFYPLKNVLEIVNLSGANFSGPNVTSVSFFNMFYGFNKLKSVDLSNANTSKVTSMKNMFDGCGNLINVIGFNTLDSSKVIAMNRMFSGCSSLVSINMDNQGGNSLYTVDYMFGGCSSLKKISMRNFNFGTSYTVGASSPFYEITTVEEIDISNSIVTNDLNSFFSGCTSLKKVSLVDIDTSNVTDMSNMFSQCLNLKTIYVSNTWDTSSVTSSSSMFSGCTSLVGGNGTAFDSSKTDKTMAVIDTPTTPGYLTMVS